MPVPCQPISANVEEIAVGLLGEHDLHAQRTQGVQILALLALLAHHGEPGLGDLHGGKGLAAVLAMVDIDTAVCLEEPVDDVLHGVDLVLVLLGAEELVVGQRDLVALLGINGCPPGVEGSGGIDDAIMILAKIGLAHAACSFACRDCVARPCRSVNPYGDLYHQLEWYWKSQPFSSSRPRMSRSRSRVYSTLRRYHSS